jgi:hypothetical protein
MDLINYHFLDELRTFVNRLKRKKPTDRFFHTKVLSTKDSSSKISDLIQNGKPFMIAKFGESELEVLRNYFAIKRKSEKNKVALFFDYLNYGDKYEWTGLNTIVKDSGFFPANKDMLPDFAELYIDGIKNLDVLATTYGMQGWYNSKGEDYILKFIGHFPDLITTNSLDPYLFLDYSWTRHLAGKRVLIIHPFENSIREGYKRRNDQFPQQLLPDFELKIIKSVQSIAYQKTGFSNWFEALSSMQEKIKSTEFDIALLGCGAYGLPLASYIKSINKQAIHIGGSLQIYFGIIGNRWTTHPVVKNYINEFWIKPDETEIPEKHKIIGDGNSAYW